MILPLTLDGRRSQGLPAHREGGPEVVPAQGADDEADPGDGGDGHIDGDLLYGVSLLRLVVPPHPYLPPPTFSLPSPSDLPYSSG